MTIERLKDWCAANGAAFSEVELSRNRLVLDVLLPLAMESRIEKRLWRTGFVRSGDEENDAIQKDTKASALLQVLEHKYPAQMLP